MPYCACRSGCRNAGAWRPDASWADCSTGAYATADRNLCIKCTDNCVTQFSTVGRGYLWGGGYHGDCPFLGYHLYVLNNTPDMNAVLIEGLFHTNYDDVQVLKTSNGRNLYAEGLYDGVCLHYGYDPHPSPDIIIDNTSGSFSCSANWSTGSSHHPDIAGYRAAGDGVMFPENL